MANSSESENQQLRRRLKAYVTQAQQNELKLRRFQQQELTLMAARSLRALVEILLYEYRKTFDLDAVTLLVLDPEHETRRILEERGAALEAYPDLLFTDTPAHLQALYPRHAPVLGPFDAERHAALFPRYPRPPASVALLPLLRGDELIGSFHLGSRQEERFLAGTATDFLERIAAVAAVCLENAANHERLKRAGLTDPLTGVHNRRYFDERVGEEVDRARREGRPLSCLFLDLDHFKAVNDNHGHQSGDAVLQEVARRLKRHMRMSDVLARYGGEEFAALLVQTDARAAAEIAERIRSEVSDQPVRLADGGRLGVSLSIGCATLAEATGARAADLIEAADAALYRAKRGGRNRVETGALAAAG